MSASVPGAAASVEKTQLAQTRRLAARQTVARVFNVVFLLATCFAIFALAVLLWTIVGRGWDWLSWDLITRMPSRKAEQSGLNSAVLGTIWVISLTSLIAFPLGVGAAIYLEEYAPPSRWTKILQVNIANLSGVPSVVYGLLGLGIFAEMLHLGRVILVGALTMAVLSLPVIIIASQEAIRAVPWSLREAAFGVGATKWQVARHHVLPAAFPGILTGTILAISRAIGETAPLLVAGASAYVATRPDSFFDSYTTLPIQIYNWTALPQKEFRSLAAAGIIVLLLLLLTMNSVAIILRQRATRKARW
ncbi:MAG: phosphate transport system permease protein [Thermomicrobiales bacterium]|nr:phosphate transport system permease protein [Thermomicrobiales bacterium]MEA2585602.1 phosphate transport system permease protein [Thermomicrobiales bacterium]MEA2597025.1 phosphate transport system permease protein [Thermomicrobiales bacterium]